MREIDRVPNIRYRRNGFIVYRWLWIGGDIKEFTEKKVYYPKW
jgi:hypothetical protein